MVLELLKDRRRAALLRDSPSVYRSPELALAVLFTASGSSQPPSLITQMTHIHVLDGRFIDLLEIAMGHPLAFE